MKVFLYFSVLACVVYSLSLGSKDGTLDPGRIVWPKETWVSSPIELSRTNSGLTVSITFNFRPSTSLSNGYIQIILPSGLSGSLSTIMPVTADQDTAAIFSIALPSSAGVYGPFGIITRTSSTGQIIDANYIFGCIATTSPAQNLPSLTVSTYLGLASPVISTTDSLYFTFFLTSSLWRHDLIEIIPATDWTVSRSVRCSSIDISGVTNMLYGYNDDHTLPCGTATSSSDTTGPEFSRGTSNSVYIYGIDRDVIISSSIRVSIKVSTFTLPGYVKSSWSNTWIVKIWRFGTNNLLAQYSGTGPVTTAVGAITFNSWTPISDIDTNLMPSGITLFTKVTFTNSHTIPKDGSAAIYFSNVDISGNWWIDLDGSYASGSQCYISSQNQGAACKITSSDTVTLTFSKGLPANSIISICLLTALSSNAKISAITTYYAGTINIDSISNPYSWPFNAAVKTFGYFQYHAYKDKSNSYPAIGSASPTWFGEWVWGADITEDLYWAFLPNTMVTWTANTIITVHLPISQVLSFTETYISLSSIVYDIVNPLTSAQLLANPTTGRSYSINGNVITAKFSAAPTPANYFVFSYTGNTALPFVTSNLATFYECWAKSQTGAIYELGNSVFTVRIGEYFGDDSIYTKPLCLSTVGAVPLITHFTALHMDLDFASTATLFAIEVSVTNGADLGTGLEDGSRIPCSATLPKVICTLSTTNSGADSLVTIRGLSSLAVNDEVYIYTGKGIQASGIALSLATSVYYTTAKDLNIRNYLYTRLSDDSNNYITYTTAGEVTLTSGSSTAAWDVSSTLSLPVSSASIGSSTSSGTYIGIGLPVGFKLDNSDISINSHFPMHSYQAANSDDYSIGGFIMGIDDGTFRLAGGGSNILVNNIIAPGYAGPTNGANNIHFNVFIATSLGSTCDASDVSSLANKINVATISNSDVSCTSSASPLRWPDSVDSDMIITINLHFNIPSGGIISLAMDNNWVYGEATCSVSGQIVSCSPGLTTTITLAKDFAAGSMKITFLHVLPPISGTASCVSTITVRDSNSNYIAAGSGLSQAISLSSAGFQGTSKIVSSAIPNFAGAVGVDIYLSFSLNKSVPSGGILYISPGSIGSWLKSGDIKDYCWSNIVYTSCTILGSDIQFSLKDTLPAGTDVQLYLDSAITLPSDEGVTSSGFKIISKWNDVTITSDNSPGYVLTVNPPCDGTISLNSVTQSDVENAGEEAIYLFSFLSDQAVVNGDHFIIQFPRNFDPYIGNADNTYPDCEPYDWYLACSSAALGNVVCKVDHWYLKISGITKSADKLSSLDLTINGVWNPAAVATGYFNLWHYGSNGSVKAFINSDISTLTSDLAKNLLIFKALMIDNSQIGSPSTYSFDFYCEGTLTSDYAFIIKFPAQFNLKLTNGGSTHCNTKYYDDSGATKTDPTVSYDWNDATTCSVDTAAGTVTLSIPDTVSKKFAATNRIRINLIDIVNAQWGLTRIDNMWDNRDTDAFGSFSYWTNKFTVNLVNNPDKTIIAKGYPILNGAYAGFSTSTSNVDINWYNPLTGTGKVHVAPGTQSKDITITVSPSWPMKSKTLKLVPISNSDYADNGNLEFTSAHYNFIVYQMTKTITFRVSAKIGTATGIYYVDWETSESRQPGVPSDLYSVPLSLLIEVCTPSALAQISVASIPTLYRGHKSIPIAITLSQSPATELIISLTVSSVDISVYPNTLTFGKDTDMLYFEISVSAGYELTQASPVLSFIISGIDKAAFGTLASVTLQMSSTDSSSKQPIITISANQITENSATLTISSPQTGVLYWGFSCQGAIVPSFNDLYAITADLVSEKSGIYTYQKSKDIDYASTETDIDRENGDTDINSFFRRMHSKHCTHYYTNSQVIYSGVSTQVVLDNLMVNTSYVFTAYVDDRLNSDTSKFVAQTKNFTTQQFPSVWTQSVSFSWIIPQRNSERVRYILAKNMGVNPSWLTPVGYSTTPGRILDETSGTTTFTYNVIYDRSTPYSPSAIVNNLDETQATKDFFDLYSYAVNGYRPGIVYAGIAPSWVVSPVLESVNETTAIFNASSSVNGIICALCTDEPTDQNTYAWQVIDGINANLIAGYGICGNSTAGTNLTLEISGLTKRWYYQCYFTACNDYPIWPSCIEFSEKSPLISIPIWTVNSEDDGSIILQSLFCVFISIFS